MKYIFLQDVHFATFECPPESEVELGSDLRLTTNPALAAHLFSTVLEPAASRMHLGNLKNVRAHIYVPNEYPQPSTTLPALTNLTETFILMSGLFLQSLWLVRDNSVNTSQAYVAMIHEDGRPVQLLMSHSVVNSTSRCRKLVTDFTARELETAIGYFRQMLEIVPKGQMRLGDIPPSFVIHSSRLGRALYMVQPARSTSEVAFKLMFYCIALETLFSTVDEGVSGCVAKRTAAFLEEDAAARRKLKRRVQKLYAYRSMVVHGNRFSEDRQQALYEIAIEADECLRRTFRKILADPKLVALFSTNDSNALNEHFGTKPSFRARVSALLARVRLWMPRQANGAE